MTDFKYISMKLLAIILTVIVTIVSQTITVQDHATMYRLVGEYSIEQLCSPGDDFVLLGDRFITMEVDDAHYLLTASFYDAVDDVLYMAGHGLGDLVEDNYYAQLNFSPKVVEELSSYFWYMDYTWNGTIYNQNNFVAIDNFDELYSIDISDPIWIQKGKIKLGEAYLYYKKTMVPIFLEAFLYKDNQWIFRCNSSITIKPGMSGTPVIQNGKLVGVLYAGSSSENKVLYVKSIDKLNR